MDKETLSNYGWIVICVMVIAVMIALASPFGTFVSNAVKSTTQGLFGANQKALNSTGLINMEDQWFDGFEMLDVTEVYTKGSTDVLTFRSSAPVSEFKEVRVDNEVVDPSNYTVTEGSTIITFTPEYSEQLKLGNHTIAIVSGQSGAKADFIVVEKHGLHYGEAYIGTMDGATVRAIFNEDTSAQLYINGNLEADIPAGFITYTKETVDMTAIGYGTGVISADGKTINIDGLVLTLTKSVNIEEIVGKRYKLVQSMGTLIFTENKAIEVYDLDGYLYGKLEAEDIQWNDNRFTVSNLSEDISDFELYQYEICNDGQYIKCIYEENDGNIYEDLFAFDETYQCTHIPDLGNGLISSKTYWLDVYDENGKYVDGQFSKIDSIEQMKNYSMVCSLCGEIADFYIEGNYIYLKNHQLESQMVNGERIQGTCWDSYVSDYLGWHAIPYDIAKTDGMLQTVNGEAITVAYMYPNVSLPNTIVALYDIYDSYLFENATESIDYYIEYAGTTEQFAQIKSFYDNRHETALAALRTTAEHYDIVQSCVVNCSDGDIVIK